MKRLYLCLLGSIVSVLTTMAQSLSGQVTLNDSVDSPIATIRIDDLGIGTTAKIDGTYKLNDIKPGTHIVEFSYVGYKTVTKELTFAVGEDKRLDVELEQTPITLGTVFVTPDGSDASHFILNKVWEQAERRYKAAGDFKFHTTMLFSYRDFDLLKVFINSLPPFIRRLLYMAIRISGYKDMMDIVFAYPHLDLQTTNSGSCIKKRYKWGTEEVKRCNVSLTDREKKALNKLLKLDDLYKSIYVDNLLRKKKASVKLKGSYDDGSKVVYILEGKLSGIKATMHVFEDSWDVVKYVEQSGDNKDLWELRKSVGDLYMPVSYNSMGILLQETSESLQKKFSETIEKAEKDKLGKKEERLINGFKDIMKMAEERGGIDCRINQGVTINYNK